MNHIGKFSKNTQTEPRKLDDRELAELRRLLEKYPTYLSPGELKGGSPLFQLTRLRRYEERLNGTGDVDSVLNLLFQPPVIVESTPALEVSHFGLKTLDSLTTAHMTPEQALLFSNVLARVRDWRQEVEISPNRSFILSSRFIGIGKTHIAEAMCDSFRVKNVHGNGQFINGQPNFRLLERAKLVTGKELMEAMDLSTYKNEYFIPGHFSALVLDDVGREGSIKFEKREEQSQHAEKQARYFHIVDHIYKTGRAAIFITSNLTLEELAEFFGPATWSRLIEMSGRHMVGIKTELPDMRVVKAKGGV